MCSNCSNNPCTCGYGYMPLPQNCCSKSKTDNINYSGPNLSCLNINLNDDLTTIIQILTTAICANTTTSTTTTQNCFIYEASIRGDGLAPYEVVTMQSTFGETSIISSIVDVNTFSIQLVGAIPVMDSSTLVAYAGSGLSSVSVSGNMITFDNGLQYLKILHCTVVPELNVIYRGLFTNLGPASIDPCGFPSPTPLILYYATPIIITGTVLYTDLALTTPLNGGNQWVQGALGTDYQVNNLGVVITVGSCI